METHRLYSFTLEKVLQVDDYKESTWIHPTTEVNSDSPVLALAEEGDPNGLQAVSHDL
jgi:hypothetical protein